MVVAAAKLIMATPAFPGDHATRVWEEIRLPGLESQKSSRYARSHGKEVRTDLGDFKSVMLGVAAYGLAIESFRRTVDYLFYSVCF